MLQDKYNLATSIINEHNDAIGGVSNPGYVDLNQFLTCIKAQGGTSEDRLKGLSYEDILDCLPAIHIATTNTDVKPVALAKAIAKVFRDKEETTEVVKTVGSKKAEKLTVPELVEAFDPEDFTNAVGERLRKISRGEKFIVYSSGRTVDLENTKKLILEIKQGYPGRDSIEVNGKPTKTYRVGELPEAYAEENPLYPNRPLRPDGTCDQLNRSWEGVPLNVRQLIRIALENGEISISGKSGRERANDVLDFALKSDAMSTLRKRYHEASLLFDEKEKTGSLPLLKISLEVKSTSKPRGIVNPFNDGKKVVWAVPPSQYANYYKFGN